MVSTIGMEPSLVETVFHCRYPLALFYPADCPGDANVPALQQALDRAIDAGWRDLVIDLSRVEGISPAGIGAMILAERRFGRERGRVSLVGAPAMPLSVLKTAGLPEQFQVFATVEQAVGSLFQESIRQFGPVRENTLRLRTWLRSVITPLKASVGARERIEAAASEAFANAVQHATPCKDTPIEVRVVLGSVVLVEIKDQGPGFQALQYFNVDPLLLHTGARGLGIYVMRNLMDQVEFIPGEPDAAKAGPGTTVRLIKRLERAA